MANKRTIAVVTSSRADYGIMKNIIRKIHYDKDLRLKLFVTGSHLLDEYGLTYQEIEQDKLPIFAKLKVEFESKDDVGIAKSMGETIRLFAENLQENRPDILLLLGDRYEIFAVATAAYMLKIPIAHIAGGDSTEGALDEALRHSITKMSHIHFVTNEVSQKRVLQLGENPDYVFLTGNPSLDDIQNFKFLSKQELSDKLNFHIGKKLMIVTYHPQTLGDVEAANEVEPLLSALGNYNDTSIIITGVNADTGGEKIDEVIKNFVQDNDNVVTVKSLGHAGYFSAVKHADAVVGNSSSGIIEVPSLKTPTVNIGDRQKGRICGNSVINVSNTEQEIKEGIDKAMQMDRSSLSNPHEQPNASEKIISHLKNSDISSKILQKTFFDTIK